MALLLGFTYCHASHFGVYLVHLSIRTLGFLDVFVLPALHLIGDMERAFW